MVRPVGERPGFPTPPRGLPVAITGWASDMVKVLTGLLSETNSQLNLLIKSSSGIINVKDFGAKGDGATDDAAAFTTAIAELSSHGGIILCPNGDYTATTVGSITVGSKVVTFWANDATLPSNMPGVTHATGTFSTKMVQSEGPRTGEIFHRIDVGDRVIEAGRIDRIVHVVGQLPEDASVSTQRELHAFSFELETDHHENQGGDIRGIKGIVRADGAAAARTANIRAVHVTAEGFNGHAGDLTGVLASVMHTDETNGVWNPVGMAIAVIGQVRAGCLGNFEARAWPGDQRPTFAFRVRGGANAVKPESACFDTHGGGNGDLYRGTRDEDNNDVIYSVDNNAQIMARSFYSGRVSIDDDAAVTITVPSASGSSGFIEVWAIDVSQTWGKMWFRASGTALAQSIYEGTALDLVASALTGTDGVDGQLSVGVVNDGTIDIENRLGSTQTIAWAFITSSSKAGQVS